MRLVQATSDLTRDTVFLTVFGPTSSGRTTFALTAPSPILLFHAEPGKIEEPVRRAVEAGKEITMVDFSFTPMPSLREEDKAKLARKQFDEMAELLIGHAGEYRSVVMDTHTDAYELLRFARFGRLSQVQAWHYAPLNTEWTGLFRKLKREGGCHFIGVGKTKEEYRGDKGTGRMVQAGQKEMGGDGYLPDVVLESYRSKDKKTGEVSYGVRVEKGWNQDDVYYGMEFDGGDFTGVMEMLSPENSEVWK